MIKVINNRSDGSMFHYAHFLCDCLFPEIINNIYNYQEVVRKKNLHQTIGIFHRIYTNVLTIKNTELLDDDFDKLNIETLCYNPKENYTNNICFDKFRNFIFLRYQINQFEYDTNYPEVLLIKRGGRNELIDDEYLKNENKNVTNGKERREIDKINQVNNFLMKKYQNKFKSMVFERLPFQEQVKYFNNAKLIICAHGAVMSNMFFCKERTKIIEVTCDKKWIFYDKISKILKLKHIKCSKNIYKNIINCIKSNLI